MAYFGVWSVTDEGSQSFGGNVNVQFVNTCIRAFGNVQKLSIASPQRIMHAGWVALGYSAGVFPLAPPGITWWKYLEFESESLVISQDAQPYVNCDTLYYHLNTGVGLDLFIGTV